MKVVWGGDPLELVSELLDGVREALYVSSAIIEEVETHDRRGLRKMARELRGFES